jgi:UDP-glucose 4-epimerase
MRVVVVGATGNVGTSVVSALADEPTIDEILGLARRRPDWSPPKTTFADADVVDADLTSSFAGAEAVVHLAWLFQPTHRPAATWDANVIGSTRVFEAVAAAGVRTLVHASSVGTYSTRPSDDHAVDESWPTHATNSTAAYGREKAYVERVLDAFERARPDIRVVRLRPAFIFKREAASSQRRLFTGPLLPDPLLRPGRLPLLPLPRDFRLQAVHSTDVADAYVRAVTSDARGPFNIAADDVLGVAELGRLLGARPVELPTVLLKSAIAAAWHSRVVPAAPELIDMAMNVPLLDSSRAHEELGWRARRSAADAVLEVVEGIVEGAGMATDPLTPRHVMS